LFDLINRTMQALKKANRLGWFAFHK